MIPKRVREEHLESTRSIPHPLVRAPGDLLSLSLFNATVRSMASHHKHVFLSDCIKGGPGAGPSSLFFSERSQKATTCRLPRVKPLQKVKVGVGLRSEGGVNELMQRQSLNIKPTLLPGVLRSLPFKSNMSFISLSFIIFQIASALDEGAAPRHFSFRAFTFTKGHHQPRVNALWQVKVALSLPFRFGRFLVSTMRE